MRFDLTITLVTALILGGCGGGVGGTGGNGGGGDGGGNGGVGGTGVVSLGTVTKAEPTAITVNGTAYQVTAETQVSIDANNAAVTDLQPGMVVEVDAYKYLEPLVTEAEKITYKNSLTGPISKINADCGSMFVLGQLVEADSHTLPALTRGLCDFGIGQLVEISGFISDPVANSIRATFIRVKAPSEQISVSGSISSVSAPQKLFVIGALTIDYGGAIFEPLGAVPEAGKFVRVEGISTGLDTLTATEVEVTTTGLGGAAGTEAEVTGFISDLSGSTFSVNSQAVDASKAKVSPATAVLANGVKVEVHGKLNAKGVIDAIEIEVKVTSPINIQSSVEAIDANGLTLLGTPILVNDATVFKNESGSSAPIKLSDIRPNDQITVSCYRDAQGNLVASKVELKKPSAKFVVEGEVIGVQPAGNSFSMIPDLNITVVIDPASTEIKGKDEHSTSAVEFLAQLHSGARVKAEGVHGAGTTLDARSGKVELKDGND